jgi:hypothetical protein
LAESVNQQQAVDGGSSKQAVEKKPAAAQQEDEDTKKKEMLSSPSYCGGLISSPLGVKEGPANQQEQARSNDMLSRNIGLGGELQ